MFLIEYDIITKNIERVQVVSEDEASHSQLPDGQILASNIPKIISPLHTVSGSNLVVIDSAKVQRVKADKYMNTKIEVLEADTHMIREGLLTQMIIDSQVNGYEILVSNLDKIDKLKQLKDK